jgi:hypothetical protein
MDVDPLNRPFCNELTDAQREYLAELIHKLASCSEANGIATATGQYEGILGHFGENEAHDRMMRAVHALVAVGVPL